MHAWEWVSLAEPQLQHACGCSTQAGTSGAYLDGSLAQLCTLHQRNNLRQGGRKVQQAAQAGLKRGPA